jgi:hypothetical protein
MNFTFFDKMEKSFFTKIPKLKIKRWSHFKNGDFFSKKTSNMKKIF